MSEFIDIFLRRANVERIVRILFGDHYDSLDIRACRAMMTEYIYRWERAGAFDVWRGTRASIYIDEMNRRFLEFVRSDRMAESIRAQFCSRDYPGVIFARADEQMRGDYLRTSFAQYDSPMRCTRGEVSRSDGCLCDQPTVHPVMGSALRESRRDDEGATGCGQVSRDELDADSRGIRWAFASGRAGPNDRPWATDVDNDRYAMSGDPQYHLIALDAMNARAPRMARVDTETQKMIAQGQRWSPHHVRVRQTSRTIGISDYEREAACDIFSRDSKEAFVRRAYIPQQENVEPERMVMQVGTPEVARMASERSRAMFV